MQETNNFFHFYTFKKMEQAVLPYLLHVEIIRWKSSDSKQKHHFALH